ncbi:MAG: c-type cytochrome [Burkholderiales bacterium]
MFTIRMHTMLAGILIATVATCASAQSPIAQRGRQLYETNCTLCHQQSVHSRTNRVARSMNDIREYVKKWSGTAKLNWTSEDIDEVSLYLNERFYRFVSPYEKG